MKLKTTGVIISLLMILITLTGLVAANAAEKVNGNDGQSTISVTLQQETSNSALKNTGEVSIASPIIMTGQSKLSVTGKKINFSTSTFTIPSVSCPLVQATSELYYKKTQSSKEAFKISAFKQGTNVKKVEAKGFFIVKQSGYYQVIGHHRIVSPPGYKPSEAEDVTYSKWKYVSV